MGDCGIGDGVLRGEGLPNAEGLEEGWWAAAEDEGVETRRVRGDVGGGEADADDPALLRPLSGTACS